MTFLFINFLKDKSMRFEEKECSSFNKFWYADFRKVNLQDDSTARQEMYDF